MDQDQIGRKDIVNKICGLVDSLQTNKNFCLALNGAWGSGKTFVMEMIEEKLKEHKEYLIVKYDAWKNNFYPDPLIAILYCVLDSIKDNLHLVADRKIKKLIKSAWKHTSNKAIDEIVSFLHDKGGKYAVGAFVVETIINVIKQAKSSILDNKLFDDYKSYQSLLSESIEVLNALSAFKDSNDKQSRLIILVDEVDRCLPDEQLKVLERLHHLFAVKNCAVIVAMNQSCVAKTVQKIYGIDGYEYLRKFFNFSFKLEMSADEYLKNLFESYIMNFEKFQGTIDEAAVPVKLAYQCLLYGSEKALEKADNRELTRYFECITNVCNDFGWQRLNQQYVFFILLALYIRKIISPTFLNADEIITDQNSISETYKNLSSDEKQYVMPYYDYLDSFLGVDRQELPDEIKQLNDYRGSQIPEFSWVFNEMVYYSMGQQFPYNEMRRFFSQPTVKSDDCKELCRLIILYGGEQERCER